MRLVFFGSGSFGLPSLERMAAEHRILAVVTQPDRRAGRGGRLTPTSIADWVRARSDGAELLTPGDVNESGLVAHLQDLEADARVVIAYGQKLGPDLLTGPPTINLHASLLPRWRGAAPINHAILAGDAETGNSVIDVVDRMDAGAILGQSRRAIDPTLTAGQLHDLLAQDGAALLAQVLARIADGTVTRTPQNEALVTRAPKLSRTDAWIDFADDAGACRRRVHGLAPWPGVSVSFRGRGLKLLRVQETTAPAHEEEPGRIIDALEGTVQCGQATSLRVLEVQPEARKAMTWRQFAIGQRVEAGERLIGGRP